MVSAIASFGNGYKAPNYEKIRTTLLDKEKAKICGHLSSTESSWEQFGCSIVSDGWTYTSKRPLIFMVSSAGGVVFKKSIDTSSSSKIGEFIAATLLDIIREVGEENVVQVITDSAANCKLAGHLVEEVFPHIFWTPCATHCLNLLLKDLALIGWMGKAIDDGKEVQQFISNHDATRSMISKFFELKLLLTTSEWDEWKKQNDQADIIEKRLLSGDFWEKVEKYVKVLWPIMAMLHVVDRDWPIMGVVYEAIDQMLEQIKEILKEDKDGTLMYEEIHELAQGRWDMLHSPLHATVFLLNPILFSKKTYKDKENYGTGALELQRLATRVLSQVSSASTYERNWSTYGFIHSLKRNHLGHNKADDLVYVHSNLRFISRKQPSYLSGPCKAWDVLEDGSSWDASFEDEDEDEEMFPRN
ncbi:hypothetical protein L7F22_058793 [Adiantum nelumboides]|nr:hypothetical protein [Adiantum nelumboides]